VSAGFGIGCASFTAVIDITLRLLLQQRTAQFHATLARLRVSEEAAAGLLHEKGSAFVLRDGFELTPFPENATIPEHEAKLIKVLINIGDWLYQKQNYQRLGTNEQVVEAEDASRNTRSSMRASSS